MAFTVNAYMAFTVLTVLHCFRWRCFMMEYQHVDSRKIAEARMPFVSESKCPWFCIVNFWNSMPEGIVTAPSVNIFKGRFDKEYTYLHYCTDIDYVTVRETGLQVLWPTWIER